MSIKKMIPFYIIKILEELTDDEHALLPTEIMGHVNDVYGDNTIAKTETVIENIENINSFYSSNFDDTDIIQVKCNENSRYKNNKRYFLAQRKFEFAEIIFLHNLLLNSNALPKNEIIDICSKLTSFLSKSQQKIMKNRIITDGSTKTQNRHVYINLEIIQQSIINQQNIEFIYNEYNMKKQLVSRERPYPYIVSPYGVICSYGSYFLIGHHLPTDMKRTYRIDKITNIKNNSDYKYRSDKNFDLSSYIKNSVFMHTDEKKIDVRLRCEKSILDAVIERFENCRLSEDKVSSKHFLVTIPDTTYVGMKYWILEFISTCEVLEPKELREDIRNTLEKALNRYN